MNENYTYPVVLDYDEEGFINIEFPDFENAVTSVEVGDDPIQAAQDYLTLIISQYEDDEKEIPAPSDGREISMCLNCKLVFINIWMPYHRSKTRDVYVKKTLTIPSWINHLGIQQGINFSAVLVKAMKRELGI